MRKKMLWGGGIVRLASIGLKKGALVGLLALGFILLTFVACTGPAGPTGPTGPAGPTGPTGPAGPAGSGATAVSLDAAIHPESCITCHGEAGPDHQARYDLLYQDEVIKITDMDYSFSGGTITITFNMTKAGQPFDGREADSLGIYFAPYTGTSFEGNRLSLKGTLTYDGAGGLTSALTGQTDISGTDGLIVVYGRDETVGRIPGTRVDQNRYPFAAILETGSGVDYASAANVAGCEKCHTVPYLKHSYIYGQVNHDAATDFYTCKACHLDNGEGGHFEWQLLVDDPAAAADYLVHQTELSAEQLDKYAYKT
ncbi:MAG: collagen-like protein, partial [Dehalococcoidales bacterium]|nr:collagen-like protein [Dehalococcoidales bacterium]